MFEITTDLQRRVLIDQTFEDYQSDEPDQYGLPDGFTREEYDAFRVVAASACEWFALCDRLATHNEPHPILGSVPACSRCPKIGA